MFWRKRPALRLCRALLVISLLRPAISQAESASKPASVLPTPLAKGVVSPLHQPAKGFEVTSLYLASAAYGLGVGVWLDLEFGLKDSAVLLLPPTILAVGLPITAYLANQPRMLRGTPQSIVAGAGIGALEALAVVGMQRAHSDSPWGGLSVARAVTLGTTAGALGGYAFGEYQQPSPLISAFAMSGSAWGAFTGSLAGLALAPVGVLEKRTSLGAALGLNAGLLTSMGLSTLFVPSASRLTWMWIGAGVGAVVSAPVFLFYIKDGTPPMRRGFLFTGVTTGLGVLAAGVFGPEFGGEIGALDGPSWLRLHAVAPLILPGGGGLSFSGSLL